MVEEPFRPSEARAQEIAERAAAKAIHDAFRLLGTDITELEDINNLRDDFRFIKRQRALAEFRRNETHKSTIAGVTGGVIGMLIGGLTWLASILRHSL